MKLSINNENAFSLKVLTICIMPILVYYKSVLGVFSELTTPIFFILLVEATIVYVTKNKGFFIKKSIFIFLAYFAVITLYGYLAYSGESSTINSLFVAISVVVILTFNQDWIYEKRNQIIRYYLICTWIVVLAFIVQYLAYFLLSKVIVFKLPGLTTLDQYGDPNMFGTWIYSYAASYSQFSGFFSEKAHFSTYIIPAVLIYLEGYESVRRNAIKAAIISVVVLFSASSTGVLAIAIIWMLELLSSNIGTNKKILICFLLLGGIGIHFSLIEFSDAYANSVGRLFDGGGLVNSKTSVRIFRGFDIFSKLPLINMIFGIGYRQYSNYSMIYNISSSLDEGLLNIDYFNTVAQVLIYTGIVGMVLVLSIIVPLLKHKTAGRKLLLVYLALSFGLSIFLDTTCFLYFVLILALNNPTYPRQEISMFEGD